MRYRADCLWLVGHADMLWWNCWTDGVVTVCHSTVQISPSLSETTVTHRPQGVIIVGIYMFSNILLSS